MTQTPENRGFDPSDPFLTGMVATIRRHDMLQPGDRVLAGVSGGPDSVALVHGLHQMASALRIEVAVAHLDHGLRPAAAEQESRLVADLARSLGIMFHADRLAEVPRGGSLEAQLRELRYAFFERTAAAHGYTKIALGHHADDNAEAVLLHLLRGSGLRGLSGIPPVRSQRFIRPLIELRRNEILQYLQRHHLAYADDASNRDLRFERNKIRHQLIPLLQDSYNPGVVAALNRTAMLCREEEAWFAVHLQPLLARALVTAEASLSLRIDILLAQPLPLQRRLIRDALRQWQGHVRRIGAEHLETLVRDLVPGRAGRSVHLPSGLRVERTADLLCFTHTADPRSSGPAAAAVSYEHRLGADHALPFLLEIPEAGCRLRFSGGPRPPDQEIDALGAHTIVLDRDRLAYPLIIRSFRPGDRFQPFGMQGRQKLKDLFINRKLPADQRRRVPLLLSGEEIVWVAGLRRGAGAPVTATTNRILRVELEELP